MLDIRMPRNLGRDLQWGGNWSLQRSFLQERKATEQVSETHDTKKTNPSRRTTNASPSPRVAEHVKRILTVGSSHVIRLSSPLRNSSKAWACFRNTSNTAAGELHLSNWAANGWVCRSFFVVFLYSFIAASNIEAKLETEGSVACLLVLAIERDWIAVRDKLLVGKEGYWVEDMNAELIQSLVQGREIYAWQRIQLIKIQLIKNRSNVGSIASS